MSSHALLSPSAASRWLNCTPAPRLEAELPESTSEYAAEGTLAHSVCELLGRKKFTIVKPSAHNAALKKLKKEALWDDEMLTTAATYVEHLMERSMAFPGKGLNFITMESQERVRGHALFCYILILKKELMNMTEDVVNAGYTIIERFPVGEQGFAIGHPVIEWSGNNTYIQSEGINQDFGIYNSPDELLKEHGQEMSPIKEYLYRNLGRHLMNSNVKKIRNRP